MLNSTQDDSLVFANELRKSEKWSEPELPETSDIFGSPKTSYEPTQVDKGQTLQETQVIKYQDHEIDASNTLPRAGNDVLPIADPSKRLNADNNNHDTQIGSNTLEDAATQVDMSTQQDHDVSEYSRLTISEEQAPIEDNQGVDFWPPFEDTQIIDVPPLGISSSPQKLADHANAFPSGTQDTHNEAIDQETVINTNRTLDFNSNLQETQVINQIASNNFKDTQVIMTEHGTDLQLQSDLQRNTLKEKLNAFDDTQVIQNASQLNYYPEASAASDNQAKETSEAGDHFKQPSASNGDASKEQFNLVSPIRPKGLNCHDSQDLNKTSKPPPHSGPVEMLADAHDTISPNSPRNPYSPIRSPRKSSESNRSSVESNTQRSSTSPARDYQSTEMLDKERITEFDKSLIDDDFQLSQDQREPTTQVLNTQEDAYNESSLVVVDLSNKPVNSSSQESSKRNLYNLSIVSIEDDNSEVEDLTFMYEDSIFNQKKRKLLSQVSGVSQTNGTFDPSKSSPEKNLPDLGYQNSQISSFQDSIHDGSDPQPLADSSESRSVPLENSPTKANFTSKAETVKFKDDWSSSSSELQDISRDPSEELDVNFGLNESVLRELEDGPLESVEEVSQEVRATNRRRSNVISDNTQSQDKILRNEVLDTLDYKCIVNPDAVWVFSLFRNFPGQITSFGADSSLVLRKGSDETEVRNSDLHILDIRVGDFVLVGLKFGQYVVTGLAALDESQLRCIRGFDTVYIAKKGKHGIAQGKEIRVFLSEICLEVDQMASHQQKFRVSCAELDLLQIPYLSVHELIQSIAPEAKSSSNTKLVLLQSPKKRLGLFAGMFFFVTSIEGERKNELFHLVTSNGGVFIDGEIDLLLARSQSSSGSCVLSLKQLRGFKFGALLSEGYSRSPKYLQALALGWPILADVFIDNVLQNPDLLKQWQAFLLPAGVSFYFNGAKSHEVFQFRKNYLAGLDMGEQLSNNAELMSKYNILVLEDQQDQKVLDMCGFIFHAFGAKSLTFFANISSIEKFIRTNGLDSFLVYDNNDHMFKKKYERKRKARAMTHTVGIIDWEWVVQCLISNLIWKPLLEVQV